MQDRITLVYLAARHENQREYKGEVWFYSKLARCEEDRGIPKLLTVTLTDL